MNTNGSKPQAIEKLCAAGLNSIRISLNSAQSLYYQRYYQPRTYNFDDVVTSLQVARRWKIWTSVNYFIFPGFTDSPAEMDALKQLADKTQLNMIQTRNLNIDPELYIQQLQLDALIEKSIGIPRWLKWIKENLPWVKIGYFNPPAEEMKAEHFV